MFATLACESFRNKTKHSQALPYGATSRNRKGAAFFVRGGGIQGRTVKGNAWGEGKVGRDLVLEYF